MGRGEVGKVLRVEVFNKVRVVDELSEEAVR